MDRSDGSGGQALHNASFGAGKTFYAKHNVYFFFAYMGASEGFLSHI